MHVLYIAKGESHSIIDGSLKSSQVKFVAKWWNGIYPIAVIFPNSSKQKIRVDDIVCNNISRS